MKRFLALLVAVGVVSLAAPQDAQAQHYRGGSGFSIAIGNGGFGGFGGGYGGYGGYRGGYGYRPAGFSVGYSSFRPSYGYGYRSYGRPVYGGYGGGYRGGYGRGCGGW